MSGVEERVPYRDGREHVMEELGRLDVLVRLEVLRSRNMGGSRSSGQLNGLAGLYIKDEEIDRMTAGEREAGDSRAEAVELEREVEEIQARIGARVKSTPEAVARLPLLRLGHLFCLSPFERDVILICLAPELDLKYEKVYAYLQDDVTRKQPTVDLMLRLLGSSADQGIEARACFLPQSPLLKYELVTFTDGGGDRPLLARCLKLDERIVNYLLGFYSLDSRLTSFTRLIEPRRDWSALILPDEVKGKLVRLSQMFFERQGPAPLVFYFQGPMGAGRKLAAEAFCRQVQFPLLVVDTGDLLLKEGDFESRLTALFREALLQPAALYFEHVDRLFSPEERNSGYQNKIFRTCEELPVLTFLAGEGPWLSSTRRGFGGVSLVQVEFPLPPYHLRTELWNRYLSENNGGPLSFQADIEALASRFRLTGGQIRAAAMDAFIRVMMRERGGDVITTADLFRTCRDQSNRKLSEKAQKITPRYGWQDIVLPPDRLRQLREISYYVKYRQKVFYEWGFERKLSLGKGVNILFSGPSGTGKTMAAEVIAHELDLDLYKIDLSSVVSKYIGETEKNLAAIFKEAETSNAILFFDEADALFGKRSEVKDSHDRYANIEIGYLLQRMEEYTGAVILATNMQKNMDEAFVRRMHFTVEFPFPEEESRLKIWQHIFPPETPLAEDIDFDFLKRKFRISGGNIKNIALAAAFYAADADRPVAMAHLILASKREFQKMGKVCLKSDFDEYYHLLGDQP
jgi:SpoVK/Ycf46/Vps4 family AAA+-type ATPase